MITIISDGGLCAGTRNTVIGGNLAVPTFRLDRNVDDAERPERHRFMPRQTMATR